MKISVIRIINVKSSDADIIARVGPHHVGSVMVNPGLLVIHHSGPGIRSLTLPLLIEICCQTNTGHYQDDGHNGSYC